MALVLPGCEYDDCPVDLTRDQFKQLFATFDRNAFRLETLQTYRVPADEEAFAAFKAGVPRRPETPETSPWLRLIADTTAAGRSWARVHLIDPPLSDYLRYELVGYEGNAAAGEDVRLATRGTHPAFVDAREDWWLFDDELLVHMRYDDDGRFLGAWYDHDDDLEPYLRLRDVALAHSTPLAEFTAADRV